MQDDKEFRRLMQLTYEIDALIKKIKSGKANNDQVIEELGRIRKDIREIAISYTWGDYKKII